MELDLRTLVIAAALLSTSTSLLAHTPPPGRPTTSDYGLQLYKPGYLYNFEYIVSTPVLQAGPFTRTDSHEILRVRSSPEGIRFSALVPSDGNEAPIATVMLRPLTTYGARLLGAAVADFNNDGRVDALVAGSNSLEMITYNGSAAVSASFRTMPGLLWIDSPPVAADFNRDGDMDIVFHQSQTALTPAGTQARLVVLPGDGAHDFEEGIELATGGMNDGDVQHAVRLVTGDFNRDGWVDVASLFDQRDSTTQISSRSIKVFLNDGTGILLSPYTVLDDPTLVQIAAGDVDGDGWMDLVATRSIESSSTGSLDIFKLDNDGRLGLATSLPASARSSAIDVADLDGDGRQDVVVGSTATYRIASYLQKRDGTLAPATFSTPIKTANDLRVLAFNASSFTVTDLTADGCRDLLIAQGEWRLRGQGCARTLYTPGDMDDDGKTDLLWLQVEQRDLALWGMDGPSRAQGLGYLVSPAWRILATGDFNGDRWMDLLWTDGRNMQLWEGDGLGRFVGSPLPAFPQGWRLAAHGDFDGDGSHDLFWRNDANTDAALWRMEGANIIERRGYATSPAWLIEGSGDFNADGRQDLLWTNGTQMQLWQTQSNLQFAGVPLPDYPTGWQLAGLADVSGDGKVDLLWSQPQIGELAIWEYRDAGHVDGRGYAVGIGWWIVQTGDFNADGYFDLVWTNGHHMQLWQSQGNAFLGLPMDVYPSGWTPVKP